MTGNKSLWEILVPVHSNDDLEYPIEHHHAWDEQVRTISKGLTIMRTARGQWVGPEDKVFHDRMIPVRIYCTEEQIDRVIGLTMRHYDQLAVMAYEVSSRVKLVNRDETRGRD